MKYVIRAIKYFIYITVIFAVVIWILACFASKRFVYTPADIVATLINGWKSVGLIEAVFAGVSCFYPLMGYMKRPMAIGGSVAELKDGITGFMESRGYVYEKETEDSVCYRIASGTSRLSRTYEDRITISQSASGLVMEGLRKDVARLAAGLETRLGAAEDNE